MIHLSRADYRVQPWANGRGQTVELARAEDAAGLLWRLSVASVVENGPFSRFAGINRSLTVIRGPGFTLRGADITLHAAPLTPVTFPGDIDIAAHDVTGPSQDFNVMVRATLPPPEVSVATGDLAAGGLLALYAVEPATVNGVKLQRGDLILTEDAAHITGGTVLAARILGLSNPEKRLRQPRQ
jgi:uncharacterized protein